MYGTCVSQNVIDGDLSEMFNALDASKQKTVAEELDRTPSEVLSLPLYLLVVVSEVKWYR